MTPPWHGHAARPLPRDDLHGVPRFVRRVTTLVLGVVAVLALLLATVLFFADMTVACIIAAVVFVASAWGSDRINGWGRGDWAESTEPTHTHSEGVREPEDAP